MPIVSCERVQHREAAFVLVKAQFSRGLLDWLYVQQHVIVARVANVA